MQSVTLKSRKAKCSGWWYPAPRTSHDLKDNPISNCVIAPHAGFDFSGRVSMHAISYVKKNRVWILGTSHYEKITNGISIFHGTYCSSIGKTSFPSKDVNKSLNKYYSPEGHRTEEHSIENVLYCLNHFASEIEAFCALVQVSDKGLFEGIAADIASAWNHDDSIIVSTDWNHFVPVDEIDCLMNNVANLLSNGEIELLYNECLNGNLEACGIDALFLASKVLIEVGERVKFNVLASTNSSDVTGRRKGEKCVGYLAAANLAV